MSGFVAGQVLTAAELNTAFAGKVSGPTGTTVSTAMVPVVEAATLSDATATLEYTASETGGTARIVATKLNEYVSVLDFGADPSGTTDSTTAFQNAINTGLSTYIPKGTYALSNAVTCSTQGQIIFGDGRDQTTVSVDSSGSVPFNLSATGVFVVTSGEPGTTFRDFRIFFTQPDTNVRANLVTYPPAIYAQGQPRCTFQNLRISAATICADIRQNSGGCVFLNCEFSAFTYAVWIDGAEDSIKFIGCHFWNFDLTANQLQIYIEAATIAIYSGRCDDLHVSASLLLCGTAITTYIGTISGLAGVTFGEISNCDFDSYNGINMVSGFLSVSNCTFTQAGTSNYAITTGVGANTYCYLSLTNSYLSADAALSNPQINITGAGCSVVISSCIFDNVNNVTAVGFSVSAVGVVANSNFVFSGPSFANPVVVCYSGSVISFEGNSATQGAGGDTGDFLDLLADDNHIVTGNNFNGWGIGVPSTYTTLILASNISILNTKAAVVTASRALSTVYTNSTNKPMFVSVAISATATGNIAGSVDGQQIATVTVGSGDSGTVTLLVPEKGTYEVVFSGTGTISSWYEAF